MAYPRPTTPPHLSAPADTVPAHPTLPARREARDSPEADPRQLVLQQTLSIMTATTEDQLIARTLKAACEMTGAPLAAALNPDGTMHWHGDPELAARFGRAGSAVLSIRQAFWPAGRNATLAGHGLPAAVTVGLGSTLVVLAGAEPGQLGAQAGALLALLVAHALATRERLRERDQLSRAAESDPLTGLPHKRPFARRLDDAVPGRTAVIAVDVDDFKQTNDRYGHQAGDHLLLSLTEAMRSALRGGDQLYRIGGDEFAVILDVKGIGELATIARRLLDAARQIGQTVSLGAALQAAGETGNDTLGRADKALYQAKRAGRDCARLAPAPVQTTEGLAWRTHCALGRGTVQEIAGVPGVPSTVG